VERVGYQTNVCGLNESRCKYCGADLNFTVNRGGKHDD
jgi:hypothetical protein